VRRRLAAVAFGVGVVVAAELLLRWTGAAPPEGPRFVNEESARAAAGIDYEDDPALFWRLPRDRTIVGGMYRTNALGLRGGPIAPAPDRHVLRVALVGDSCPFGLGLDLPDTVGARLEALRSRDGRPVQVVRLGVPGYSSLQALGLARRWLPRLRPDATVLWVGAFNDAAPACGAPDAARRSAAPLAALGELALVRAIGRLVGPGRAPCPPPGSHPPPRVPLPEFRRNVRDLERLARAVGGRTVVLVPLVAPGARSAPWARVVRSWPGALDPALDPALLQPDGIHPGRLAEARLAVAIGSRLGLAGASSADELARAASADRADRALARGDAAAALAALAPLLPVPADRPRLAVAHAAALAALGRWAEARDVAAAALARHPRVTELRRLRAEALAALGDDAGAVRELERGIDRDAGWLGGRVALVRILESRGEHRRARAALERARALAPGSRELRRLERVLDRTP